ncbi:hypothetical protein NG895_20575 [Aeoliella sp. ICT_H6.2]|uniref:Uncharacterized protein n=1 Tax=Aeoliella straminimaris TaxID=2954799 RepID=A0A9X2JHY3_9BACT|nr:hypothetical protein [Aeoliella straminimaris]MCO6046301.1 hypothetical protein [Aeoliella straminimaris]
MAWILWILGIAAALFLGMKYMSKRAAGQPLLSATIATSDGQRFSVSYKKLHPDVQPVEYVRLALLLAAKMIFNTAVEKPPLEAKRIMEWMEYIGNASLTPKTKLHDIEFEPITVQESMDQSGRKVEATLGLMSETMRSIHTSVPMVAYPNQSLHTWLAVVQTSLPKLDQHMVLLLRKSLARMLHHYYDLQEDPSSLKALVEVPNVAFMESVGAP